MNVLLLMPWFYFLLQQQNPDLLIPSTRVNWEFPMGQGLGHRGGPQTESLPSGSIWSGQGEGSHDECGVQLQYVHKEGFRGFWRWVGLLDYTGDQDPLSCAGFIQTA